MISASRKVAPIICYIAIFVCVAKPEGLFAQIYANMPVGEKQKALKDSLEHTPYDYMLPIWGKKAAEAGFNLPYSAGVGLNYLWQQSDLIIDNLNVGFNNGPMHNLDGLVRFNKAVATAQALTIRPDIWLFPFLNVYGILGRSSASTDVGYGMYIPDSTNTEQEIFSAESKINFQATTAGFGLTPTIGLGGGWLAIDMNFTWTDVPQLSKPAYAFIFGPRAGKTFQFKKPEQNIAVWVGAFRVKLNSATSGSVNLADVLPTDEFQEKVSNAQQKVGDAQNQVNAWWNSLSPPQQSNPINQAKYQAANSILSKAAGILDAAETALNDGQGSTVQYSMDKRPKDMWNFIIGTQFQYNKSMMFRLEVGFLGSRVQTIAGIQYRFGL
jgi:hypothetical protein